MIWRHKAAGEDEAVLYHLRCLAQWQTRYQPRGVVAPAIVSGGAAGGEDYDVVEAFDLTKEDEEEAAAVDVERWIAECWVERVVKAEPDAKSHDTSAPAGGALTNPAASTDRPGWKALRNAVDAENTEQILELAQGGNANSIDASGGTAMHWAAERGMSAAIGPLFEGGADIDRVDHAGLTPLMLAAVNDYADVLVLLLQAGADLHIVDRVGNRALDWAQQIDKGRCGSVDVLEAWASGGEVPAGTTFTDAFATRVAARHARDVYEAAKLAVELQFNRVSKESELARGVSHAQVHEVRRLLAEGADANYISSGHNTSVTSGMTYWDICSELSVLSLAAAKGHNVIVFQLLQAGAIGCKSAINQARTPLSFYGTRAGIFRKTIAILQAWVKGGAGAAINEL
jgi:hypothetical protein